MSKLTRIAIINNEKCKPTKCNFECGLICPQNKQGKTCVELIDIEDINMTKKTAKINESICIGCGLCTKPEKRGCPFGAITIVNVPTELNGNIIMRYGENGFRLYRMPILSQGRIIGFIGQNGIGKSTMLNILSDRLKPNFEKFNVKLSNQEIITKFKGTEMHKYMQKLYNGEFAISIKPQHIDHILKHLEYKKVNPSVRQFIQNRSKCDSQSEKYSNVIETLELCQILDLKVLTLSGGELQRVICATTLLTEADVYIFDEFTNYLDVRQRLNVAKLIKSLQNESRYIAIIEHDLAILDYISDQICILYGKPSAYGVVSRPLGVANGINEYFDGFIQSENMRFRTNEYDLGSLDVVESKGIEFDGSLSSYDSSTIEYSQFKLNIEAGSFVTEGSMTIIMGKNGTGKTTFINQIARQMNQSISYKPQYLAIDQFIKQDGSFPTVKEFLYNNIREQYTNAMFLSDVVRPMMINNIEDRFLNELSGGEAQRFWLTYCLGLPANIYLIDEPSACLDIEQRVITTKVLKKFFMHNKKAGFIVEHDMMIAVSLGAEQNSQAIIIETSSDNVSEIRESVAKCPVTFAEGINEFLKSLNVTFHTSVHSKHHRPRINKANSAKDREQKSQNKYYS